MDFEWLASKLLRDEHVEDGPELDKTECQKLLDYIAKQSAEPHLLIVNVNIETDGIYYDYLLDSNKENKVVISEWDNRYL
jgi:hypothetical protein